MRPGCSDLPNSERRYALWYNRMEQWLARTGSDPVAGRPLYRRHGSVGRGPLLSQYATCRSTTRSSAGIAGTRWTPPRAILRNLSARNRWVDPGSSDQSRHSRPKAIRRVVAFGDSDSVSRASPRDLRRQVEEGAYAEVFKTQGKHSIPACCHACSGLKAEDHRRRR